MAYQFEKARKAIHHAINALELLIIDYRILSNQERVLSTHGVLAAVRSARRYADGIERYFEKSLIDEFKIDYRQLKNNVRSLAEQWEDVFYDSSEFKEFSFSIDEDTQLNTVNAMNALLKALDSANRDIKESMFRIYDIFNAVDKRFVKYSDDAELRRNIHEKAYIEYLNTNEFKAKKRSYTYSLDSYIKVHGNTCDAHRVFCNDYELNAGTLFRYHLDGGDVSKYMVEHRTEISGLDVENYYYFHYVYNDLQCRMMRFEYEKECDSHYAKMFKRKAEETLAVEFAQVFHRCIDKLVGNKYAMVMLAMRDMKIIEKGQYGSLFVDLVNSEILRQNGENEIKDAKTITDIIKKVKNNPFKRLSEDDLKDSLFNEKEFNRLSDIYWQCISIMNLVFEYDLREKGFAEYLCVPHERTPNIDVFGDIARVKLICSVLKG